MKVVRRRLKVSKKCPSNWGKTFVIEPRLPMADVVRSEAIMTIRDYMGKIKR